jgi:hypothetical protein
VAGTPDTCVPAHAIVIQLRGRLVADPALWTQTAKEKARRLFRQRLEPNYLIAFETFVNVVFKFVPTVFTAAIIVTAKR